MSSDNDFRGKVAVITGSASGIGLSIASHAAGLGMRLVLADIEGPALDAAAQSLTANGADVTKVQVDVSDRSSVENLAAQARRAYDSPWLVVNNAGVALRGRAWDLTHADWEWVMGVNLWGVIHGIETFLPDMIDRNAGHIVNTASMAGLVVSANTGAPYAATKHAVIGLSEAIYRELQAQGSDVGMSVLCPGAVSTNIDTASRNRDERFGPPSASGLNAHNVGKLPGSIEPDQVADDVFQAIVARRFWILTHAERYAEAMQARAGQIRQGDNPDHASEDWVLANVDA